MEHLNLYHSKKCRSTSYEESTQELSLDFARDEGAAKIYRYLGVPTAIWAEINRRHLTHLDPDPLKHESVGEYLGEAVTGSFKDKEIPFAWEKLGQNGEVIERSAKPVKQRVT
jgi:hypothetical protein